MNMRNFNKAVYCGHPWTSMIYVGPSFSMSSWALELVSEDAIEGCAAWASDLGRGKYPTWTFQEGVKQHVQIQANSYLPMKRSLIFEPKNSNMTSSMFQGRPAGFLARLPLSSQAPSKAVKNSALNFAQQNLGRWVHCAFHHWTNIWSSNSSNH